MQGRTKEVVRIFSLSDSDRQNIRDLLNRIIGDSSNTEEHTFLESAAILASELPRSIRECIYDFKLWESSAALLITRNPISSQDIGPTPDSHWRPGEKRPLGVAQILHGLYSSLLGEPFGFETQQYGRIFNDLIPLKGMPSNSSSGSGDIGLHTEDCFQPFMPDYLGLMCLRNEQRAKTTVSSIWNVELPEEIRRVLWEERFAPKLSIINSTEAVAKRSVLFGDPAQPYMRFGSIDYETCDLEATAAMRFLATLLERNRQTITLNQGDCLYVDNYYAVHGRAAYQAEYGANGRWFSRLVMARDLRKTRTFRSAPEKRVMLKHTYAN